MIHIVLFFSAVAFTCAGSPPPSSPLYDVLRQLPGEAPAGLCQDVLQSYLEALDGGVPWALKLYDSSVKYPDGLLSSNGYSLGNFDACVAVRHKEITGKYCLVKIRNGERNSSKALRFKVSRHTYHIGTCLPSACSANELQAALQRVLVRLQGPYSVIVDEDECAVSSHDDSERLDLAFCIRSLFLLAVVAAIFCTWKGYTRGVGACFSVTNHWMKLFDEPNMNSYIGCIHGLRAIAICIVVIGHRAEAIAGAPLHNPDVVEKMYENAFNVLFLNATVVVDIFFTISGFLLCWKMMQARDHGLKLSTWDILRHRYIRLTPAYLVTMLFQGWMMEDLGSGPLWGRRVGREATFCRNNWWANLLYIHNFYKPGEMCVDPSWYLACDMQLLLLVPLVIQPLLTWKKYRLVPFLLAFTASFWVPFFVTWQNGLDPTVIPDMTTVVRAAEDPTNQLLYVTTYCRAGPYLVGIAAAFFLHRMQQTNFTLSEKVWDKGWYIAVSCMVGSVALGYPFFTTMEVNPLLTALYAASFRTVFSLGIAFVIVAGTCTHHGAWLSSPALLPLSKLSYSIYLTHTLWIQMSYSWMRSPLHSTDLYQASIFFSDLFVCVLLATMFHLLLERPMAELAARFMSRGTKNLKS